jgi:ring-1,2-phenylacetyl-CoA epoxidase subunit PaaD
MSFHLTETDIWSLLEQVKDPEIPVLSIVDLGVLREVKFKEGVFDISITPTYTGCPAMNVIEEEIKALLERNNVPCSVHLILSPAWTTDWMTESGKQKLKAYGIAPPQEEGISLNDLFGSPSNIVCPLCNSTHTELISQFGSTACKSLYKCLDCKEPFDYFKCHR